MACISNTAVLFEDMTKKIWLLLLCTIPVYGLHAQTKTKEHIEQVWLGYFNQTRFTNHWGIWTDLHLRTRDDFINKLSQSIVRLGLTYYLTDATKFTIGYAYVSLYPGDNHKKITQPEHRPWQQLQWHTTFSKSRLMQ